MEKGITQLRNLEDGTGAVDFDFVLDEDLEISEPIDASPSVASENSSDASMLEFDDLVLDADLVFSEAPETTDSTDSKKRKRGKNSSAKKEKEKKMMTVKSTQIFSPIRSVKDGIIVTKDNDFIMPLEFSPINFMLRNEDEQDVIIKDYASVIKLLPKNVQFKVVSRRADTSNFVKKIMDEIPTEESPACRQLQREQISLIQNVGNTQAIGRRFFMFIKWENTNSNMMKHITWDDILQYFSVTAERIAAAMKRIGNELISPTFDDEYTMSMLYSIMSYGQSMEKSYEEKQNEVALRYLMSMDGDSDLIYLPPNDMICPQYINAKNKKFLIVDGVYYAFAYIPSKSYPGATNGGWMNLFTNLGAGIDVDLFMSKQDIRSVQTKLQYAIRLNKINAKNTEDTSLDYEDKLETVNSGYYLKSGITSGDDFIYMSTLLTITANSEEQLMSKCDEIKQFCITADVPIRFCYYQQLEAFRSSLPIINLDKNLQSKMKRNILGNDFAASYPFSSYEISDEDGVLMGINQSNRSLVFVDNFDSTKYANANMAIIGTTGAGKTYTLQTFALRMREKKTQVFIIAPYKGHEFKRACDAIGGAYVKIAPGSVQNINIMEIRKADRSVSILLDGENAQTSLLSSKIQQLHTFFTLLVPDISNEEKQLLDEALIQTYAKFGITTDNASLYSEDQPNEYKTMPTLGDLYVQLGSDDRNLRIRTILTRYVTGSAASFNAPTNVDLDNKYVVLDVSALTPELLPMGMFLALDYVWDKTKEDRTKKKAIFIDEVWRLTGSSGSVQSRAFVDEIFRTIRAYGGAGIASTQNINDVRATNDDGTNIISLARIKFVMKLEHKEAEAVQNVLNLTDKEVEECVRFERGTGILMANTNHVLVEVTSSKHEGDLITTDRRELDALASEILKNREKGA